jgi:hypothetical protein
METENENTENGEKSIVISGITKESLITELKPMVQVPPVLALGRQLINSMLIIISGVITAIFILIFISYFFSPVPSMKIPESLLQGKQNGSVVDSFYFDKVNQLLKANLEERREYRSYIKDISQILLVNILLPVLTSILGYTFGSKALNNSKLDDEK